MGFFAKLRDIREYKKAFVIAKLDALDAIETSMLAVTLYDTKRENVFSTYSTLMDLSENYWNRHKRLIDKVIKYPEASTMAKQDAISFARIYDGCAKKLAFVCTAFAAIGGFQPVRCKEMLENIAVYPEVEEKKPTR